jgi:mono/diheme cytochrome c family protein
MNLHRFACAVCLFLFAFAIVGVAQETTIDKIPIKHVAAHSGEGMYTNYCAVCHGTTGIGNGPAAKALNTAVPDLTTLSRQNNGKFPELHVYTVIRGDTNMPAAHGGKDMPVWGALFVESCGGVPPDSEVHQRIRNLTKYVQSLQKK